MRCNQVSINIERFGKFVPDNYPNDIQEIHVYCDDFNSIYAALSKAYALAVNELAEYENIGCRTDVYTNEFNNDNSIKTHAAIIPWKQKYEEDVNLQFLDTDIQLCKDRIWIYENSESILAALKECEEGVEFSTILKEKFNLNDYQVRKLSQIRFDMMTKKEYESLKNKVAVYESKKNSKESDQKYKERQRRIIELKINELKAYFTLVDNYDKFSSLIMNNEDDYHLTASLVELGIARQYVRNFKYINLNELSRSTQDKKRKELEHLEESLKFYSD